MTAKELLNVALTQVGYIGKKSNDNLDSFTENVTGKFTKYARDLYEAGYYNGNKNGFNWCAVFVDWCFYRAAGYSKEKASAVKPVNSLGASVTYTHSLYSKNGRLSTNPSVGAQIFYKDGTGGFTHTGLVYEVHDTEIVTIEGNWGDKVSVRTLAIDDNRIADYGLPYYEADEDIKKREILTKIAELNTELSKL